VRGAAGVLEIAPGETRRVAFVLGQGRDAPRRASSRRATRRWRGRGGSRVERFWDETLGAVQVPHAGRLVRPAREPLAALPDLSCRIWARSGPYQPGGAFGFRDQLQDVLALLYTRPDLCRAHLLRAAARQFVEGDVQHWWHPPSGRGTRTRCSDDLLWLPYAVGQLRLADRRRVGARRAVPFLEAPPLEPDQAEAYIPVACRRDRRRSSSTPARHRSALKYGAHGLPLIGSGDWNDGMNRVGHEGAARASGSAGSSSPC
jgi:cyclic beta-1,2-glucan synthetase